MTHIRYMLALFLALAGLSMPCAANQEQSSVVASVPSLDAIFSTYEAKLRENNNQAPSISPSVVQAHVYLNQLAPFFTILDQGLDHTSIDVLAKVLDEELGDASQPLTPEKARHLGRMVTAWAQDIETALYEERDLIRAAGLDINRGTLFLEKFKITLRNVTFNAAHICYENTAAQIVDLFVWRPLELVQAYPLISTVALVASGYLVWKLGKNKSTAVSGNTPQAKISRPTREPSVYTNLREERGKMGFKDIAENPGREIEALQQLQDGTGISGGSCGSHAMFNAAKMVRGTDIVRSDDEMKKFNEFFMNMRQHVYDFATKNGEKTSLKYACNFIRGDHVEHAIEVMYPKESKDMFLIELSSKGEVRGNASDGDGSGVVQALKLGEEQMLLEKDRAFVCAAADFQAGSRAQLVVLVRKNAHWIAIRFYRNENKEIMWDIADSMGCSHNMAAEAAQIVLNPTMPVLRDAVVVLEELRTLKPGQCMLTNGTCVVELDDYEGEKIFDSVGTFSVNASEAVLTSMARTWGSFLCVIDEFLKKPDQQVLPLIIARWQDHNKPSEHLVVSFHAEVRKCDNGRVEIIDLTPVTADSEVGIRNKRKSELADLDLIFKHPDDVARIILAVEAEKIKNNKTA